MSNLAWLAPPQCFLENMTEGFDDDVNFWPAVVDRMLNDASTGVDPKAAVGASKSQR
jgi:hypothetical protein